MKVLIMNPILYTSETDQIPKTDSIRDTMIYALCMGFLENGDQPTLIAAQPYRPVEPEEYPFEIIWLPCFARKVFKPRCLPLLKGLGRYLRKHGQEYDYVISSEVFSLLTLSGAIHVRNKLIIWHELGAHNNLFKKLPSRFWYRIVAGIFMRNIPVVPRSKKAADFIGKYCNNVVNIRIDHGVDLKKIPCSKEKGNYFAVVSQLIERKHIDGIIDSFAEFIKNVKSGYTLKIIGDGVWRERLERQVRELNIQGSVLFTGKLDHSELLPILAGAKALLVNTSKDNSMVSIVESIAAGTPILTTSVPFNSDYIRENELGIVKDEWNQQELKKICELNEFYVENCIAYRNKLSHRYFAGEFDKIGGSL